MNNREPLIITAIIPSEVSVTVSLQTGMSGMITSISLVVTKP